MTRVIYDVPGGTFDSSLKELGEYDSLDKELITVHATVVCIIHPCPAEVGRKWFRSVGSCADCNWTASKADQDRAQTLLRCGK